jgi:drug/metabolite transporter (DMT)-like permease
MIQGAKEQEAAAKHQVFVMFAAFAAIYIFWGSTYLGIKYAIETLPPFLMAGARFVMAGIILFTCARFSKDYDKPEPVHWRTAFIVGTLLLLGGNGGVVFAQHYLPSSMAALLVATEPFWIVLLSWLWLKNGRPGKRAILGLVVGFIGVSLLITGQSTSSQGGAGTRYVQILATLAVLGAALSWATGSIYGLKAPAPRSAILTSGMQMMSGGSVLLVVSLIRGEWSAFDINAVSLNSWLGFLYLIVFGSLIGFTAYSWLLKNASPSKVSTYAYVNPVVAVFLGWFIAGETLTIQMLVGAVVVVASVALITRKQGSEISTVPSVEESEMAEPLDTACDRKLHRSAAAA